MAAPHRDIAADLAFAGLGDPPDPAAPWEDRPPWKICTQAGGCEAGTLVGVNKLAASVYAVELAERVHTAAAARGLEAWAPVQPRPGARRPPELVTKLSLARNGLVHARHLLPALAPYLPFGGGASLLSVDLSFNTLAEVGEAFWRGLPRLRQLLLHGNRLTAKQSWAELGTLSSCCPDLSALSLHGGEPRLESQPNYRLRVLRQLPGLRRLDFAIKTAGEAAAAALLQLGKRGVAFGVPIKMHMTRDFNGVMEKMRPRTPTTHGGNGEHQAVSLHSGSPPSSLQPEAREAYYSQLSRPARNAKLESPLAAVSDAAVVERRRQVRRGRRAHALQVERGRKLANKGRNDPGAVP
jgi:hypothetical protein